MLRRLRVMQTAWIVLLLAGLAVPAVAQVIWGV